MNHLLKDSDQVAADIKTANKVIPLHISTKALCRGDIYNNEEQKLGKLHDLIVVLPAGEITFAIISCGGFWGIGEKLLAVPWEVLTFNYKLKRFSLPISIDRLSEAPSFEPGNWPDMQDERWLRKVRSFYIMDNAA